MRINVNRNLLYICNNITGKALGMSYHALKNLSLRLYKFTPFTSLILHWAEPLVKRFVLLLMNYMQDKCMTLHFQKSFNCSQMILLH